MDNIDLSPLLSTKPELYAIFGLMAYLGKKYWPLLKEKVELSRSQSEINLRQEKYLADISEKLTIMIGKLDCFATKDDVIDLAFSRPPKKDGIIKGSNSAVSKGM